MARRWRQLTVWLHILTSVGWMAQAMALCVLLAVGLAADDTVVRDAATAMAQRIDGRLLAPMAGISACTGIALAAATPWGFFLHWWVLTKFSISMVQVYAGIFVLSPALTRSLTDGPTLPLVVGTALMAGAIAFQAWVSVRKPWGRVRDRGKLPTGPGWIFAATVLGGAVELSISLVLGHPLPLLSVILIVLVLATRRRWSGGPTAKAA
ncbi:hypothetical protein O7635_07975 [Asanoa sp. WMMD1127]|uniref:hypothetical protein n=1 Tax=Asanoa sp. WMMD1127 TaxID=3016107 RepID=UPI002415F64E|nr:hypothetical protein [Asanoa sp. WMMD1127]MDG4821789.1 hypothetical protein [Asanoa sp. WMMD1127]